MYAIGRVPRRTMQIHDMCSFFMLSHDLYGPQRRRPPLPREFGSGTGSAVNESISVLFYEDMFTNQTLPWRALLTMSCIVGYIGCWGAWYQFKLGGTTAKVHKGTLWRVMAVPLDTASPTNNQYVAQQMARQAYIQYTAWQMTRYPMHLGISYIQHFDLYIWESRPLDLYLDTSSETRNTSFATGVPYIYTQCCPYFAYSKYSLWFVIRGSGGHIFSFALQSKEAQLQVNQPCRIRISHSRNLKTSFDESSLK